MPPDAEPAVVAARLHAQLLTERTAHPVEDVVARVLAVQAQDGRGARLAVRSRASGLVASDVDDALTARRSLVTTWLNRGTLHLVTAEDYRWLHPLTAPRVATGNRRRLRQEGVSEAQAERGVTAVAEAVTSGGPQTREQLRGHLDEAGVPTAGQAPVHVLVAASLRGLIVRGPMVGDEPAYASVPTWLGPAPEPLDRDRALARLARRYLAGHGPASAQDLAKWAGTALRDARRGLEAIAEEVTPFDGGLVALGSGAGAAPLPPPRLLGPFDPILHGWASRAPLVGRHAGVVTRNGVFRAVALVDGRVVATWGLRGGIVRISPLDPIPPGAMDALAVEATDVLRFLGLPDRPPVVE